MLIRPVLSSGHPWPLLLRGKSSSSPVGRSSCTRHGWIRIPSIVQYPSLLPPVGVWAVSQSQCGACLSPSVGGLPLRTPRHRRHGGPSPRHQANATRANPVPPQLWRSPDAGAPRHGGLDPVSRTCPPGRGMLLTRYAPFRRSPPQDRRRSRALPLDLHVLGLPLAFILSQDQTLHRMIYDISICYFALSDPGPASSR